MIVQNQQEKVPVSDALTALAKRAAEAVLTAMGSEQETELGITFVDDNMIQELNRRYRGKDEPTDVLSFPMNEVIEEEGKEVILLGDVVISLETALRAAQAVGHDLAREVAQLVVHGTLHLLGYDHATEKEAVQMRAREAAILRQLE